MCRKTSRILLVLISPKSKLNIVGNQEIFWRAGLGVTKAGSAAGYLWSGISPVLSLKPCQKGLYPYGFANGCWRLWRAPYRNMRNAFWDISWNTRIRPGRYTFFTNITKGPTIRPVPGCWMTLNCSLKPRGFWQPKRKPPF